MNDGCRRKKTELGSGFRWALSPQSWAQGSVLLLWQPLGNTGHRTGAWHRACCSCPDLCSLHTAKDWGFGFCR